MSNTHDNSRAREIVWITLSQCRLVRWTRANEFTMKQAADFHVTWNRHDDIWGIYARDRTRFTHKPTNPRPGTDIREPLPAEGGLDVMEKDLSPL